MTDDRVGTTVARIGGWPTEYYAVVQQPVLVRYNLDAPMPWRCEIHGRTAQPSCQHTLAAQAHARQHFQRNNRKAPR